MKPRTPCPLEDEESAAANEEDKRAVHNHDLVGESLPRAHRIGSKRGTYPAAMAQTVDRGVSTVAIT